MVTYLALVAVNWRKDKGESHMGNISELSINPVNGKEPKRLIGSGQNGTWVGLGTAPCPSRSVTDPSGKRETLNGSEEYHPPNAVSLMGCQNG